MRRRRSVKLAKWACTVVAATTAAAWVASERWRLSWTDTVDNRTILTGGRGCLSLSRDTSGIPNDFDLDYRPVGWSLRRTDELIIKAREGLRPAVWVSASGFFVAVPLWAPFLVASAAAGWLWGGEIAARARNAGVCRRCGYDRGGLGADAKCPECGAALAKTRG